MVAWLVYIGEILVGLAVLGATMTILLLLMIGGQRIIGWLTEGGTLREKVSLVLFFLLIGSALLYGAQKLGHDFVAALTGGG